MYPMNLRAIVDLLALLACSVYGTIPLFWLVVHPFVERWRASGRRAYAFVVPVWGGFIAIAFRLIWPFHSAHFYANWFAWAPASIFFLAGLLDLPRGVPAVRPHPGFRLGRTGAGPPSPAINHNRHSRRACAILFIWVISARLSAGVIGTGLVALYALAAFAVITGTLMIRIGRPRTGSAVWRGVSSLSAARSRRVPRVRKG